MSGLSDLNDLRQVKGNTAVKQVIENAKSMATDNISAIGGNWPDPILPGQALVPDIPVDVLPFWVARMAGALAESTQTPKRYGGDVYALSVLATCLHRRFEVKPYGAEDDYSEPLSLWTLTGMGSGNRKSGVINALSAPLVAWEKLERDRLRP